MATSEQLIKTQKVAIGLFNAALGKDNLDSLEGSIDGGLSIAGVAGALAAHPLFTGAVMGLASSTEAKAAILLNNFGLSAGSDDASSADAIAESYFASRINAGDDFGAIVLDAVDYLGDSNVPNEFKATANLLENKALVAATFSASKSAASLGELQNVLVGVTGHKLWSQAEADEFIANGSGNTFQLTANQDNFTGTAGNDVFNATVFNNSNTFQSGDTINGGAGNDLIHAEVGSSQAFAISAISSNVETVHFDARSDSVDSNDNNLQNNFVQVDARNMRDVTEWGTDGSRADVVIEDIEINADQITEDITFRMKDTDPGSNADGDDGAVANDTQAGASLHAFFEPNSLRSSVANQDSVVVIRLLDPLNDQLNNQPLENLPVNGFFFVLNGQQVIVQDQEANGPIQTAKTYTELADAIRDRLDAMGLTDVTVQVGGTFTESGTLEGQTFTGTGNDIILTAPNASQVDNGGFLNGVGQTGDFITIGFVRGELSDPEDVFITANLILDNVGRGSEGGAAEIGSMSTRGGVEKFNVEVIRDSWLSGEDGTPFVGAMRSTNDTLEVVDIVNAEGSTGYLYIGSGMHDSANNLIDFRPDPKHLDVDGLIDVRSVNAAEFEGNLKIGASLTDDVHDRYLKQIDDDVQGNEGRDDFLFDYNLGKGDDYLHMAIRSDLTADSDFSFVANGGTGNDSIRTWLADTDGDPADFDNLADYTAQKLLANLHVNGGDGNDTIETLGAGDFMINGGAGMDAIYADNTGAGITVDAVPGGVAAIQTIQFTAAPANNPGGVITVDGVAITVGEGWTDAQIGEAVDAAFDGSTKFATVTNNGAGLVTFAWATTGRVTELLSFDDTGTTGVTVADGNKTAVEIGEAPDGAVSEVQSFTVAAAGPTADATITVGGIDIDVLDADDGPTTAGKIAAALNANPNFSAIVVANGTSTNTVLNDGDTDATNVDAADETIFVTFTGTANEVALALDENGTGIFAGATAADDDDVAAVPANGGTNEVQTLTITGATPGAAGETTFTVDGVTITVPAAGATAAETVTLIVDAFAGSAKFSSVVDGAGDTVVFTFEEAGDQDLITVLDVDSGVLSTIAETTPGVDAGPAPVAAPTVNTVNVINSEIEGYSSDPGDPTPADKAVWTANNLDGDNELETQDIVEVSSFTGIKGQLQVSFKGLHSTLTTIESTSGSTSAFQIRQALKDAVSNDAVLSKLLVVKDGPANTFIVESLIDGHMDVNDLDIEFFAPLASGDAAVAGRTQMTITDETNFTAFDATSANAAYDVEFAQSNAGNDLNGANSTITHDSDNTINAGNGDDVIVLGTADNESVTNVTANSNDTVVFTGDNFGRDTVVHFTIATAENEEGDTLLGDDLLDFTAYLTGNAKDSYVIGGTTLTDNDIILGDHEVEYTTAADTAAKGVVLEIHDDDPNVMDVYKAESTSSSTAVTLTKVGTVDMADVSIASLTAADFV